MKHILLISYYFPPSGGSGVQRMLKFARYLPEHGWLPTVLTVDPKYAAFPSMDESLLHEIPHEVEVIHARAWDPFSIYGRVQGKKKEDVIKVGHIGGGKGLNTIARWLRGNVFLPDARVGWVPFASRIARRLVRERKFDAIMSTGPPHSCHLVAMAAHKVSGIPWVVDMRDPWVEIYYRDQMYESALARKIQTHLERKVLATANAVISVSRPFEAGLKRRVRMQHYETIPNGFDPADIPQDYARTKRRDTFTIAYIGTYNMRRHSEALVEALQKLQVTAPVELHLVGKFEPKALEAYRTKGIQVKGINYLPHTEAISYMKSADVLLLALPYICSQNDAGYIPGKLFEYMSTRRPILAMGPTDGDVSDILKQVHAGSIFDHGDQEGIFSFLHACLESREQSWQINEAALSKYERPRLTGRLAHLLDRLSKSK